MQYKQNAPKVPGYYWVKSGSAERVEYFFNHTGREGIYGTRRGGGGSVDTLKIEDWIEESTGGAALFAGPIPKPSLQLNDSVNEFVLTLTAGHCELFVFGGLDYSGPNRVTCATKASGWLQKVKGSVLRIRAEAGQLPNTNEAGNVICALINSESLMGRVSVENF